MTKKTLPDPIKIDYDKPTSEQVFEFLKDNIVSMKILPGQKIPENGLAQQFGISRTPVREAIARLVNLGLIVVRPQRGTFVSKLSLTKILEARFIREALEVAIITHVAKFHTPELIEECEAIIIQQEEAAKQNDALSFQYLDDAFHQKLADFSHFYRITTLIQHEKAHIDRVRNLSLQRLGGEYEKVLKQHTAIIQNIKMGKSKQAIISMTTHLQEILKVLAPMQKMHPEYFEDHELDLLIKQTNPIPN
ncbi:MAG: GntR family transcriptional regulator [Colwellia sp.]